MRDKQEVLEKFHELRVLKLKERKERFLSRSPVNCFYNCRLRVKGNSLVGFCQNPIVLKAVRAGMFVCNEEDTARRCRVFQCRSTVESVEREFDEILHSPARCGQDYPKLAVLIWFLQDFEPQSRLVRFWRALVDVLKSFCKLVLLRWW